MATKDTVVKKAKRCICNVSLSQLGYTSKNCCFIVNKKEISAELYRDIVLFSPSRQSNLGEKLSKRIQKHIDELVQDIEDGLDVKRGYYYFAYKSQKQNVNDLSADVTQDIGTLICLYCSGSFAESVYASIRNALAHGNIIQAKNYYILYSVSGESDEKDEFTKPLSFFLRIHKLTKLKAYLSAFQKHN